MALPCALHLVLAGHLRTCQTADAAECQAACHGGRSLGKAESPLQLSASAPSAPAGKEAGEGQWAEPGAGLCAFTGDHQGNACALFFLRKQIRLLSPLEGSLKRFHSSFYHSSPAPRAARRFAGLAPALGRVDTFQRAGLLTCGSLRACSIYISASFEKRGCL